MMRMALFTEAPASSEAQAFVERLACMPGGPAVVLRPDDLGRKELSFDLIFAVRTGLVDLLRLEGVAVGCSGAPNRLLVHVAPERYQLVRSLLLPRSFVGVRIDELIEHGFDLQHWGCCAEKVADYRDCVHSKLSKRESQILALWIGGMTNKEVAWELGISPGTLAVHRRNLYRKTGLSSLSQLVVWGLLHGVGV